MPCKLCSLEPPSKVTPKTKKQPKELLKQGQLQYCRTAAVLEKWTSKQLSGMEATATTHKHKQQAPTWSTVLLHQQHMCLTKTPVCDRQAPPPGNLDSHDPTQQPGLRLHGSVIATLSSHANRQALVAGAGCRPTNQSTQTLVTF
jgi:hypothetical protein